MCVHFDADGSTPELVTCSPPNDKSCFFGITGSKVTQRCADNERDINTCLVDSTLGPTLSSGCHCNTQMCNVYCAWIDCKNLKKPNSSSIIFEMFVDMPQELPKLCTAKCWPHL